jgi:hypothetical protein
LFTADAASILSVMSSSAEASFSLEKKKSNIKNKKLCP